MRNIVALCATALALASPSLAHAADYGPSNGTYTFSGPVTVQKNLSPATACNLTLSIVVTGAGAPGSAANVNVAPVLAGGPICSAITFSNLSYSVGASGTAGNPADGLSFSTPRVNIPALSPSIGADACEGVLNAFWLPGPPSQIELDTPDSDIPDANPDGNPGTSENPCKIIGTLTQTSGPANLTITI